MAGSVQSRVAARGFPVFDISGQSGQGALPDSTLPAAAVPPGSPTATWTDPNIDPGSVPATLPAPEAYVLGQTMWGLAGALNPDNTPRTHAAPFADPSLSWHKNDEQAMAEYAGELEAAHGPVFNGAYLRRHPGNLNRFPYDTSTEQGSPAGPLAKTTGQQRVMGGYDGVQGYGGGADGVNGTNSTMPLTVIDIEFPGQSYTNVFLNAAEVPFLVPTADQFIASAPEFPEYTATFDGPTASVLAQQPVTADTPATGPVIGAGPSLLPVWGSLGG